MNEFGIYRAGVQGKTDHNRTEFSKEFSKYILTE